MNIFKNKFYLFGTIAIVLLLAAGYFLLAQNKANAPQDVPVVDEQNVTRLSASDIGLELSSTRDKKRVIMRITKLDGISSITYELSYDAEVIDEESGDALVVSRGLGPSTITVEPGQKELVRNNLDLGTCSANICKYDKVVSDVHFVIRVNFTDGEVGLVEEDLSL